MQNERFTKISLSRNIYSFKFNIMIMLISLKIIIHSLFSIYFYFITFLNYIFVVILISLQFKQVRNIIFYTERIGKIY